MSNLYRLIWFQHFHKAAGSSIVRLARYNGERFYPRHGNGNPLTADGKLIPLWSMPPKELRDFVDHCECERISFVATEWGCPDLSVLATDKRVTLITCLREPMDRFISNFYYDYHAGYTDCDKLDDYVSSGRSFTMPNYYCRELSRIGAQADVVRKKDFDEACFAVNHFATKPVMQSGFLQQICKILDWDFLDIRSNRSAMRLRRIVGPLILGQPKLLWRRLWAPRKAPSSSFEKLFKVQNDWDYQLLDYIQSSRKHDG